MAGNNLETESVISIRHADSQDWEPAMELAWKTFLKFEALEYGEEGTENFLAFISEEKLFKMFLAGEYRLYVACFCGKVVGMLGMRSTNHISLLFVDERLHKRGIGRALVKVALNDLNKDGTDTMTVNASPYGLNFYKRLGFKEHGGMQKADGITFYPMTFEGQIL